MWVIVILLACFWVQPALAGPVLDRVMARGELVGAVSEGFPPVGFIDPKTGDLTGFDVEVTRALASAMGVKARLVTPSWEATVSGHWAGRFDVAVGSMTPTDARAEVLDFPAIYYAVPVLAAVHRQQKGIESFADLAGRKIGVCVACSTEVWILGQLAWRAATPPPPGPKNWIAKAYEGEGASFDDLKLGPGVRLDAVLANGPTLKAAIAKGYPFRLVPGEAFREPLAIAIDKGDPAFAAAIARAIDSMRANGTLQALSRTWFGEDLSSVGPAK